MMFVRLVLEFLPGETQRRAIISAWDLADNRKTAFREALGRCRPIAVQRRMLADAPWRGTLSISQLLRSPQGFLSGKLEPLFPFSARKPFK